jgi:nicotinamide-nucleotide amidase
LKTFFQTPIIYHKVVRTVGIPESFLAETIKDWEYQLPSHIKLAYLPSPAGVKLRLTAKGNHKSELEAETSRQIDLLQQLIERYIYGYDGLELEQAIGHLLKEKGRTLATAESCTGGAVAALVTSVSGSSAYFLGSVVAYSNEVKEKMLGVKYSTLEKHGAVSEQTVIEMAEGVRLSLGSDIGIATTGVAGPTGATSEKPVGTVWIAYSDATKTIAKKLQLTSERSLNIKLTVTQVLNLLRENLI